MGIIFRATEGGILYDYEYALVGATDTLIVANRTALNTAPTANAGGNKEVGSGKTVTLDGSGSDPDAGAVLTYSWTAPIGVGTLSNATSATPVYTAPKVPAGTSNVVVTLTLTVSDGTASATSTMQVTVKPNTAPVVSAGGDLEVASGGQVSLNATVTDPDAGDVAAMGYAWTATPDGLSFNWSSPSPQFSAPVLEVNAADQVFDLTVTANDGTNSHSDTMRLTVTSKKNVAPVAVATSSGEVEAGGTITLSAAGSTDADEGDVDSLDYVWAQTGGPSVLLLGSNAAEASFGLPTPLPTNAGGDLVFTVTVTDNDGASDTETIVVELPEPPALVVTATASDDAVVTGGFVGLEATVSGADPESTLTYQWATESDVMIDDPAMQNTYFFAPNVATSIRAEFVLTVTETTAKNTTRTARLSVFVTIGPNTAPVIVVTGPTTAKEGESVTLDASGSTDPDESNLRIRWVQTAGPTVLEEEIVRVVESAALTEDQLPPTSRGAAISFTAPAVPEGETQVSLVFDVMVSDGVDTSTKTVTVTVTRAGAEEPGTDDAEREKVIAETEAQIDQFVQTRMNNLIGTQPDLGSVVSGGDGTANVTMSSMGGAGRPRHRAGSAGLAAVERQLVDRRRGRGRLCAWRCRNACDGRRRAGAWGHGAGGPSEDGGRVGRGRGDGLPDRALCRGQAARPSAGGAGTAALRRVAEHLLAAGHVRGQL